MSSNPEAQRTQSTEDQTIENTSVPNPGHIEQFDYRKMTLQEAIDKGLVTIPSEPASDLGEPARFRENPIAAPTDSEPKPRNSRRNKIIAGIAAGVIGGGAAFGLFSGSDEKPEAHNSSAVPVATGEAVPGQDEGGVDAKVQPLDPATTDPEVFAEQDYSMVLSEVLPILEEKREDSLEKMNSILDQQNKMRVPDVESADPTIPNNTIGQKMNMDVSADLFSASSEENTILGKNLLAGIFKPGTFAYEQTLAQIGNGQGPVMDVSDIVATSQEFTRGKIGSYTINGVSTYVLLNTNVQTGNMYERVMTKYTSQDSKHDRYIVELTYDPNDPEFIDTPENYTPPVK